MMLPKRNDFDLLDDFLSDAFFQRGESKVMKTDIKEHPKHYELTMDLPGYQKEDIKIGVEDGYLVIHATTDSKKEEKEAGKYVRKERYYGECSRSFYVGENIETEDIHAHFKNGTLQIEIPKKEEPKELPEKKYVSIED